jgi:hypothetical protein
MKKMFMVLAATLICGASLFTSCKKDEDNTNVAEKIMGRWMTQEMAGRTLLTNEKIVYNFISSTKCYYSASLNSNPDAGAPWTYLEEANVVIDGNKVTITSNPVEGTTLVEEYNITSINDNEFTANQNVKIIVNGSTLVDVDDVVRFVKVKVDYSADILGMWEGRMTSDESVYGDAEDHRWEYLLDGTFNFFRKVNGQWQISDDDYADYFVAGNLLCTRWKNAGAGNEEHREWWEIESIENGVMKWKALRQREDGTTYTATFEMSKVN